MEFLRNLLRDTLDTAYSLYIEFLWRELKCSVTRVNTSKLNVLRDSVCYDFTILGNTVEVYFLGMLNELSQSDCPAGELL